VKEEEELYWEAEGVGFPTEPSNAITLVTVG
jgi:hypothetical protein